MTRTDEETVLARRVEEACLNGWPALTTMIFDGWLLRFSRGYTKRANSVSLLWPGTRPLAAKIRACEALYARQGLPPIFRLSTTSTEDIGAALDEAGYGAGEDETAVLYRDLAATPPSGDSDGAFVQPDPDDGWFEAHDRIQGLSAAAAADSRALFGALTVPAGYAVSLTGTGSVAAVAFGALHDGIVCLNSVATAPDFRRQGHARRAVNALLAWARCDHAATAACLPVVACNQGARTLYQSLGFSTEISRYFYRRKVA
ncbi:GNAT family N-acetyltransferase [Labrys neptuniae]